MGFSLADLPTRYTEWTQFISDSQFCIRACYPGPDDYRYCQHIYDVMGALFLAL